MVLVDRLLLGALFVILAQSSSDADAAQSCDAAGQCNRLQDEDQDDGSAFLEFPSVPDDVSMLQIMANISRHDGSSDSSGEMQAGKKYDLFSVEGKEADTLTVAVTCPGKVGGLPIAPKVHKLNKPWRTGASGVPYHSTTDPSILIKFPRNVHSEGGMEQEVDLYKLYPSFVPKTQLCQAVVLETDHKLTTDEQKDETYSVLLKEIIEGYSVDQILMTLCDTDKGTKGKPANCKMGKRGSTYDAAMYKKIKALVDKRFWVSRRLDLQKTFVQDAQCIAGTLVNQCVQDGTVTTDLKPANFVYGKKVGSLVYQLYLVDAAVSKTTPTWCLVDRKKKNGPLLKDAAVPARKKVCGDKIMRGRQMMVNFNSWVSGCSNCQYWKGLPSHDGESDKYIAWTKTRTAGGHCPANI